jgi:hypothetical protein
MGNFSNNAITDVGKMLLADVQAGAIFTPTRIVMGSGSMPGGVTAQAMTAVITPVKSLAINKKKRTPDGKCVFGGVYTNEEVTEPFYFRELALYAKAVYLNTDGSVKSEGPETLYSYGNAGATADYMPAYSTSTVVEKQMDLVTWVGNDAQVDLTIESGMYVTQEQAVLNLDYISPDTVGFDSLLDYMVSIYDRNMVVVGNITGFSDMPEGISMLHGTINVVGGIMTVSGNARTGFYYRGTNSLTQWTNPWQKTLDGASDLTIEKAIAAVKLKTPGGSGNFFKNANATDDLGTTISDETKDGVTDRINLSAARSLDDKLRLVVAGEKIYHILHTGNMELITPLAIGAAPAKYVTKVYQTYSDADIDAAMLDAYALTADSSIGYFIIYSNVPDLMLLGGVWHMTVYRSDASYGSFELSSYDVTTTRKMTRSLYEGLLQLIAWENPPMVEGVEYRTTERYQNAVVYKKVDSNGNILWRSENETTWRILAAANNVAPASVQ